MSKEKVKIGKAKKTKVITEERRRDLIKDDAFTKNLGEIERVLRNPS